MRHLLSFSRNFCGFLLLVILSAGLAACGSGNPFNDDDGNSPPGTPTAKVSPTGELGVREPIVIAFSEGMNPDSLALGGSLAAQSDGGEWSKGDETLTITPTDAWESGAQALTVDAESAAGEALANPVNEEYVVRLAFQDSPDAVVVIGQPDSSGGAPNQGGGADANTLDSPVGNAGHDPESDALFLGDTGSARVLVFDGMPTADDANAAFVLGQPDFTSTAGGVSAAQFTTPQTVSTHDSRLIVTDTAANRILVYDEMPISGPGTAFIVIGQPDMTSNGTGCTATNLNHPESHAVTPDGKLLIADSANNRVLIWNELPAANGQPPDQVLGQGDFVHCVANDDDQDSVLAPDWPPQAFTLSYPTGIWSDGERLLIADSGNNRVLIWNEFPTGNFAPAEQLLGQNSFRTKEPNDDDQDGVTDPDGTASEHVFDFPFGVWSNGMQIIVADRNNSRVLIWPGFPERFFTSATAVLGQENFQNNAPNDTDQDGVTDGTPNARTFNMPTGLQVIDGRLIVTDTGNSRFLVFESR